MAVLWEHACAPLRADIVVMAANAGFTKGARKFFAEERIHLIGRAALRHWVTWGGHFEQVAPSQACPLCPLKTTEPSRAWGRRC
ncbi:hypothetical protein [Embleya sp. NBC_00896]|uniref:hypothetical protein n=1 Tax=Embleya sp. NBC_00896 TaxID=2975961 RepID=UPI003863A69B|nr:hypothetical protein OG928_04425 [Embleya sp. NBC_00896]